MSRRPPGFFIAPFAIDGEPAGLAYRESLELSGEWLAMCDEHLRQHGLSFDVPLTGNLSHLRIKFTAASGTALATIRARGRLASSLLLAGGNTDADSEVMSLFVQSLRRVQMTSAAAGSSRPFQKVLAIKDRPLMVVVPWPDEAISDDDYSSIQELAIHIAAAFFAQNLQPAVLRASL